MVPGDYEWPVSPKWFVAAMVLAVLGMAASYDLRLGALIGVPAGLFLLFWFYIKIRFRPPPGEEGARTLQERFRNSSGLQARNRRKAARSGAKDGPDPV